MTATRQAAIGSTFEHDGRRYRRTVPKVYGNGHYRDEPPLHLLEDLDTGEILDIGKGEHEAFWAWAVIETLRHTGVRIEKLMEITHLAWCPTSCPTPAKSCRCRKSSPPRATRNACCWSDPS